MNMLKKWANRIFIDGLTGMAHGLFATLIIGTIIQQIGNLIGGDIGNYIFLIGKVAAALTGAGIGVGVAYRFKESPMVVLSAASAGMRNSFRLPGRLPSCDDSRSGSAQRGYPEAALCQGRFPDRCDSSAEIIIPKGGNPH